MQNCVFDLAALDGADKIVEEYISDFAASCVDRGHEVCNWREKLAFRELLVFGISC